jgi:hypothetical protein
MFLESWLCGRHICFARNALTKLKLIFEFQFNFINKFTVLTLILLTWTIWRAPTNASKWRMGFNPYPANVDNMASSYQC